MKKLLFLVPFLLSSAVSAKTYYVATNGNDSRTATQAQNISTPWASWRKGIEATGPGDTLFIRGGTYTPANSERSDPGNYVTRTNIMGTKADPVCIYAYPSDYLAGNIPILDCVNLVPNPANGYNTIIQITYCRFFRFKGLTIRNAAQEQVYGKKAQAFCAYECDNLYYEACAANNIQGRGWYILNYGVNLVPRLVDTTYFINCDAYDCADPYSLDGNGILNAGNGADGFFLQAADDNPANCMILDGCRSWHNSDDQFNLDASCLTITRNCWAFNGGWPSLNLSEGNGFKIGDPPPHSPDYISRITYNSIAANNVGFGFDPNNGLGGEWPRAYNYNNFSYNNTVGFLVQNVSEAPLAADMNIYRNNISYLDASFPFENVPWMQGKPSYVFTEDHNSWRNKASNPYWENNPAFTVNTADFISLDVNELKRPRKPDGSLPDINFGKLVTGSDLIDGGVADANYLSYHSTYSGSAPDLGPFEFGATNNSILVTSLTVTGAGGATTISTDNGTLQLTATILPADATNKSVIWLITSGSDKASINSAGLVTAIDNGVITAKATAVDGSGVYGTLTITITNQVIPVTNITVTGAGGVTLITTIGGTLQLNASILPANATNKVLTWSVSSGSDKASISPAGLVTALDFGTATITATANDGSGVYGTLAITISNQIIPVTSITVTGDGGATAITTENGTLQLNAEVLPANATNKTLTWSISSGGEASISSAGLVTAHNTGTVMARATANDGSGIFGTLIITIAYEKSQVKVYPNPAIDYVTIRIDEPTLIPDFIQISDFSGKAILSSKLDPEIREFTIHFNLRNGVYILQLGSGEFPQFIQKFFVLK
jgi:uncharacterized protein YjdB